MSGEEAAIAADMHAMSIRLTKALYGQGTPNMAVVFCAMAGVAAAAIATAKDVEDARTRFIDLVDMALSDIRGSAVPS